MGISSFTGEIIEPRKHTKELLNRVSPRQFPNLLFLNVLSGYNIQSFHELKRIDRRSSKQAAIKPGNSTVYGWAEKWVVKEPMAGEAGKLVSNLCLLHPSGND